MNGLHRVNMETYCPERIPMHLVIEYLHRGKRFFTDKSYSNSELFLHIPLPIRDVLIASLATFEGEPPMSRTTSRFKIMGMTPVPGYENRIVISCPDYAVYDNEPIVLIEFDDEGSPLYYEIN